MPCGGVSVYILRLFFQIRFLALFDEAIILSSKFKQVEHFLSLSFILYISINVQQIVLQDNTLIVKYIKG